MKSIYETKPAEDGRYYTMLDHLQMPEENPFRIVDFRDSKWITEDEYEKVMFWEEITDHNEAYDKKWIDNHIDTIRSSFNDHSLGAHELKLTVGILECLNEYEWFYLNGYVRLVDRYFVVRVV